MGTKDPRIDAYIEKSAGFARPILKEIRKRMHAAVPGAVETIKWSSPYFEYKGKMLGGMASFKRHCAFGFWHPQMRTVDKSLEGMGQFGHILCVCDLPSEKEFAKLAKKATRLVDDGVSGPARPRSTAKKEVGVPDDLAAALAKNARARATFEGFSYSHRKEYVDWINTAKREQTRARRLATTLEWLSEGKHLMWKYEGR